MEVIGGIHVAGDYYVSQPIVPSPIFSHHPLLSTPLLQPMARLRIPESSLFSVPRILPSLYKGVSPGPLHMQGYKRRRGEKVEL